MRNKYERVTIRSSHLLVLSHGMQSGLAVCPLQWVEMHSIAAIDLMFFWTSYFMSLPVLYDFCISKVDSESVHLAYSLLELVFVRSVSFSVSKDFADTGIQTMIDALCTAYCLTVF